MKNTLKYTFLAALFLGFVACDKDNTLPKIKGNTEEVVALNAGTVDFSKYVAVGASFTAGFTDFALFKAAQENSFPNTLAKKFAMIGGGNFEQPLMNDNIGGFIFNGALHPSGNFLPRLYFDGEAPASLLGLGLKPTTEATTSLVGDYSNYGMPGAKSTHFVYDNYAAFNPYFARIASATSATIIGDAVAKNPTFFSLSEFGGNDVLEYALSGGSSTTEITPVATFDGALAVVEQALKTTGAKGVVANLPYITSLPHFTTVPHNPVPLDEASAVALNDAYAAYNTGIQGALAALSATGLFSEEEAAKRTISFTAGEGNALVIIDESLTDLGAINAAFIGLPKYRQATAADLLLLPLSTLIPQGYGTQIQLEDKWVLTPEEQAEIKTAVDAYNVSLQTMATTNGYAFVDFNAILQQASTSGITFDDYYMNTTLVTGGLVGLDGIHLTARGYALMANKMLEAIDKTYGSNFTEATNGLAKAEDFPTNYSPTLQ